METIHLELMNDYNDSQHIFVRADQLGELLQTLSHNWFSVDLSADALMEYLEAGHTHAIDSDPPDYTAYFSLVKPLDLTSQRDKLQAMLTEHCPPIGEDEVWQ